MKFPFVFKQNENYVLFFMAEEKTNTSIPDLTDAEEVRKAIIAGEILTRKY